MTIGEVCLLTNDVLKFAAFYKQLLGVENGSNDETHQFIIPEGTALTVYNDGTVKRMQKIDIGYQTDYNTISSEPDKSGQSPRRCVWSRFANGEHG
jgi:hypothetical protein